VPNSGTSSIDQTESYQMDENSEVLSKMIEGFYAARLRRNVPPKPNIADLYAAVKLHNKFQITITVDQAKEDLYMALQQDPFAGFGYASRQNDLPLGKYAIEFIRFDEGPDDEFDLWAKMAESKVTLSWRIALAELVLPTYTVARLRDRYSAYEGEDTETLAAICKADMRDIARQFDPK
jgi:hypothetical protein